MKRVYADIVGDLFHVGHLNLFKQAREFGDLLIVGVHSDATVESYKRKPVIEENYRYEIVKNCRLVDEIIENAPRMITKEFIDRHNIDVVVHGDDPSPEFEEQHKVPLALGIMKYVKYTKGISSTEIIKKTQDVADRKNLKAEKEIVKVRSKLNNKMLHCVYRASELVSGRTELIEPDNFIQCAYLKMDKGKTFRAHKHIWKKPCFEEMIAQESWVVIRGSVKVHFFDTEMQPLETHILKAGDASFTLEGGHTYEILEDNTLVYEYKTGPYEGQELDKVFN
jgi:cytidyltransferase-like protein